MNWRYIFATRYEPKIEQTNEGGVPGNRGVSASFFPEGRTYSPPKGGGMAFGQRALSEGACGSCGSLDGREMKPPCPRAFIFRPYGFRRSPSETMSHGGWATGRDCGTTWFRKSRS